MYGFISKMQNTAINSKRNMKKLQVRPQLSKARTKALRAVPAVRELQQV